MSSINSNSTITFLSTIARIINTNSEIFSSAETSKNLSNFEARTNSVKTVEIDPNRNERKSHSSLLKKIKQIPFETQTNENGTRNVIPIFSVNSSIRSTNLSSKESFKKTRIEDTLPDFNSLDFLENVPDFFVAINPKPRFKKDPNIFVDDSKVIIVDGVFPPSEDMDSLHDTIKVSLPNGFNILHFIAHRNVSSESDMFPRVINSSNVSVHGVEVVTSRSVVVGHPGSKDETREFIGNHIPKNIQTVLLNVSSIPLITNNIFENVEIIDESIFKLREHSPEVDLIISDNNHMAGEQILLLNRKGSEIKLSIDDGQDSIEITGVEEYIPNDHKAISNSHLNLEDLFRSTESKGNVKIGSLISGLIAHSFETDSQILNDESDEFPSISQLNKILSSNQNGTFLSDIDLSQILQVTGADKQAIQSQHQLLTKFPVKETLITSTEKLPALNLNLPERNTKLSLLSKIDESADNRVGRNFVFVSGISKGRDAIELISSEFETDKFTISNEKHIFDNIPSRKEIFITTSLESNEDIIVINPNTIDSNVTHDAISQRLPNTTASIMLVRE